MIKIENHCVGCANDTYPCLGSHCSNRHVEVHCCDKCGDEIEESFEVDGEELCEYCLKDIFRKEW